MHMLIDRYSVLYYTRYPSVLKNECEEACLLSLEPHVSRRVAIYSHIL